MINTKKQGLIRVAEEESLNPEGGDKNTGRGERSGTPENDGKNH